MADRRVGSIVVGKRTIDLAGEILAIAQIARLREIDFEIRNGFSSGRTIAIALSLVVAFFAPSIFGSSQRGLVTLLGIVVALGIIIYCTYPTKRYILAIELASGRTRGLSAREPAALSHLKGVIRDVIENPPLQPTKIEVGDIFAVDARGSRGLQFGSGHYQDNQ